MGDNSIFIQIASYRDPELLPTIRDCLYKAKNPENLVFAICWQHSEEDAWDTLEEFRLNRQFRILDLQYRTTRGTCWARNALQQMYYGEKYTLHLDSHHRFVKGWDTLLIDMLECLRGVSVFRKPLITGYVSSYEPAKCPVPEGLLRGEGIEEYEAQEAKMDGRITYPWYLCFDRFTPEGVVFTRPNSFAPRREACRAIRTQFYSGHFAFADGCFAKEVQHDPNMYFHGEEITIAARAFTHGYDLYTPTVLTVWHEYTREGRRKHWDDEPAWWNMQKEGHRRTRALLGMDNEPPIDFKEYGLGDKRTLREYELYAGIDFKSRGFTKATDAHEEPMLTHKTEEEFKNSLVHEFRHCLDIHRNDMKETDYDLWVVTFYDKAGNEIKRIDKTAEDIKGIMNSTEPFYKVWVNFYFSENPVKWKVWPRSVSKGWLEKLERDI